VGIEHYLAFVGVSLLVICTPGQDTALTIRNSLMGGRRAGVGTALGVGAGQSAWTVATAAGLAVVLAASGPIFSALRLAGAAYLVYLGARSLWKALTDDAAANDGTAERGHTLKAVAAFWQGCLSNLSNVKMVVFFISLLPQFATPHPSFALLLALGFNFSLFTLAWLAGYAFAVERMRRALGRRPVRRAMEAPARRGARRPRAAPRRGSDQRMSRLSAGRGAGRWAARRPGSR
jgi:threonine/homoserine/homoserine lactone efflux protein